ncbi:Uncharacterized protein dnm_033770 [Desulfonema magnum]|uniref:Uncharacterized protein n=1 Tax=Desulfonema magnum TaxID=45655 RepID=A0A975GN34_9BACT|nr:Uncharacterized protein dnm_033770 [Desulfonema magnum]
MSFLRKQESIAAGFVKSVKKQIPAFAGMTGPLIELAQKI